jgi:hypothetical protein
MHFQNHHLNQLKFADNPRKVGCGEDQVSVKIQLTPIILMGEGIAWEGPLEAINIADDDAPDESFSIRADFPISRQLTPFVRSLLILIILVFVFSCFLPRLTRTTTISAATPFACAPSDSFVLVSLSGITTTASLSISLGIVCTKNEIPVHSKNASAIVVAREGRVRLFLSEIIDFDSVALSLNVSGVEKYDIELRTKSSAFPVALLRVVLAAVLLPSICAGFAHSGRWSLEQGLTAGLAVFGFFEMGPFEPIQLYFPSAIFKLVFALLHDAFHAYLSFYCLGLLCLIKREPNELPLLTLVLPYIFMTSSAIILMTQEEYLRDPIVLFPNGPLQKATLILVLYFALFITYAAMVIQLLIKGTNLKERRNFYFFGSGALILVLMSFSAIKIGAESVNASEFAVGEILPSAAAALYIVLFDFGHGRAAGFPYEVHREGADEGWAIGADLDENGRPAAEAS